MSAEKIYPLQCKPVLKEKIWGGRKLETLFQIKQPDNKKIGEAWMVADLEEGASTILNGSLAGKTLGDAVLAWGSKNMIGKAWSQNHTGDRYPLLIKFLDAQDDLSVQGASRPSGLPDEFPGEHSKDESWIIVQSDPGGTILHSFKPGTRSLHDFNEHIEKGDVTECLRSVEVDAGQVYRVAPGTVHALCKGVAILEIQEPSDSTFRIYDYGRTDDAGKPRPLHLEAARKVMHLASEAPEVQPFSKAEKWGMHDLLVDVPAYRIERLRIHGKPLRWKVNPKSTQSLIVLEGLLEMHGGGERLSLSAGAVVVLPAAVGAIELTPQSSNATCILAGAGGIKMVDDE